MALPCVASRQAAQGDPPHLGKLVVQGLVVVELPAHHVRVQARAADVLADPVDQQHVDALERQPRQPRLASASSSFSRASNSSGGTASIRAVWS